MRTFQALRPAPNNLMTKLDHCPSCLATARTSWFRNPSLILWVCKECGLAYSDPQPRQSVERRYLKDYDLAEHFSAFEKRKRVINSIRLDRLPSPQKSKESLLDVGCGDGQFAEAALRRGWAVEGSELNPPAAARTRERGIPVREGPLNAAAFEGKRFDVVTAWDVIEHVPEPGAFVAELGNLVAPGGMLVVTTLNRNSLVAKVFRGGWSMIVEDHFTFWDRGSLSLAFSTLGFELAEFRSYGLGRDFVSWIDRLAVRRTRPSVPPSNDAEINKGRTEGPLDWDSSPLITAPERLVNAFLNRTNLGVELEMTFKAPKEEGEPTTQP